MEYDQQKSQRRRTLDNNRKHPRKKKGGTTGNPHHEGTRTNREVFQHTQRFFHSIKMSPHPSTLYDVDAMPEFVEVEPSDRAPIVEVVNSDTLDLAQQYAEEGHRVLVLNMASDYKPGGGVRSGKTAQEECLFRRSNAHMTHPEEWYPLGPTHIVYSP